MKAMLLKQFGERLLMEDVAEPEIGSHDAVVKVRACGVCRTDIKIRNGEMAKVAIKLPHILGHEAAGEVVCVGDDVSNIKAGDRVAIAPSIACGVCRPCSMGRENLCANMIVLGFHRHGAFAEYLVAPAKQLLKVGKMRFDHAAVCTDAVMVPYHAIRKQGAVKAGDKVLIAGVGGLGCHALQIAKLFGAYVIAADVSEEALAAARSLGSDATVNSRAGDSLQRIRRITEGAGVDVVIETVGTPETLAWTLPSLAKGGRLVLVGYAPGKPFGVDSVPLVLDEWEIIGSHGATKCDLAEVIDLVGRGQIRPQVSLTFPLAEANEALAALAGGAVIGRAVLTCN